MKPEPKRRIRKAPARRPERGKAPTAAKPVTKPGAAARAAKQAAPVLSSTQRKKMRGLAHALQPIVQVGHAGVTEEILVATRRALLDHELVKVRLREPEDKQAMAEALAQGTTAALCGLVGHTVILFKPHPDHPKLG
jgi:RNA-binding protein